MREIIVSAGGYRRSGNAALALISHRSRRSPNLICLAPDNLTVRRVQPLLTRYGANRLPNYQRTKDPVNLQHSMKHMNANNKTKDALTKLTT